MNAIRVGDGVSITMVFDGDERQSFPNRGNFLGLYFIPPSGDYEWVALNGDNGTCDTEGEARQEIEDAWGRS